jgi:hypothetical protein
MNLGSLPVVPAGDTLLNSPVNPGARAGAQVFTRDGRRFRLFKSGVATTFGAGNLLQGAAPNNGHLGLTPTADVPVGSRTIRVTAGPGAGTNVPANTYAGGLVFITAGTAGGLSFGVKSHDAIVATQPFTIVLESDDVVGFPLVAATDRVNLIANPYFGSVLALGTANAAGVSGVSVSAVDPGNWGFVQVEGLAIVRADAAAIGIGQAISPSVTVAGSVVINSTTLPIIGSSVQAAIASGFFAASLTLP